MEIKPREQIAIALFTGAIIALFIFIGNIVETFLCKILIVLILGVIIFISLKVILDPLIDLHDIKIIKILKRILRIK